MGWDYLLMRRMRECSTTFGGGLLVRCCSHCCWGTRTRRTLGTRVGYTRLECWDLLAQFLATHPPDSSLRLGIHSGKVETFLEILVALVVASHLGGEEFVDGAAAKIRLTECTGPSETRVGWRRWGRGRRRMVQQWPILRTRCTWKPHLHNEQILGGIFRQHYFHLIVDSFVVCEGGGPWVPIRPDKSNYICKLVKVFN